MGAWQKSHKRQSHISAHLRPRTRLGVTFCRPVISDVLETMTDPKNLTTVPLASATEPPIPDETLVERARAGDASAFELLMRRHNRRVYRVVRSVVREGADIEDVMQQAYVQAFTHLDQFEGASRWSTWLCRIAFNEALARLRQRGRFVSIDAANEGAFTLEDTTKRNSPDPERAAVSRELGRIVEHELDRLPDIYRTVVMFREVEGLSTSETATILGVEEPVVKTRLHRARAFLRDAIERRIGEHLEDAYEFGAERCDRVVAAVMSRLTPR
jgi:RNA polymerase sigma-70 factor (ECF subfamily)